MKILVFSDRKYGCGGSIAAARLAHGLGYIGHEVDYVFLQSVPGLGPIRANIRSITDPVSNPEKLLRVSKIGGVIRRISELEVIRQKPESRKFRHRHIFSLVDELQPDIINIHNNYIPFDWIDRLAKERPVVWTLHDAFAVLGYNYYVRDYHGNDVYYHPMPTEDLDEPAREALFDGPGRLSFVSPSKWLKSVADDVLKDRKPVAHVPNGIFPSDFMPLDKRMARAMVGLPSDKFTFLFLASQSSWQRKNSAVLFDALRKIPNADFLLLALGSKTDTDYGYDPRIIHHPSTSKIPTLRKLYSAADIFCIPSLADNLPNTVLEAMFCGTPVLGSNRGGIPEMVKPDINGWLFDPYDADSLAKKMQQLIEEWDKVKEVQKTCRDTVLSDFDALESAKNYTDWFEQCLK